MPIVNLNKFQFILVQIVALLLTTTSLQMLCEELYVMYLVLSSCLNGYCLFLFQK